MKLLNTLLLLTFLLAGYNSQAMLVEKQLFEIKSFKTENGALINPVKVGWEAYGTLNTDKSNVILITHFFSGSSHAAGKYSEADAAPGYWDAIIGPGKAIDTNKYYVISVDTLVNANVFDPNVITTGPATINPATGKPYGLSFPVVTIGDFVEVQKALLDSLGVDKLHAVVGGSMGSFQAIEWATRYPERVERLIPVIGTAYIDAWAAVRLERWAYPIKQDPAWRGGDYYQHGQPEQGLTTTLAYIIQDAVYPIGFNMRYPAPYTDQAPHQDILASFSAWDQLMAHAKVRAKMQDANHILYLIRASQLYRAGMGDNWQQALSRVQANTLFLPASGDQLLLPHMAKTSVEAMKAAGKTVEYAEIPGIWGHLDGVVGISAVADTIRKFLETE
ncbi:MULTISPECIES: E22 family MetX-like putative esterase [unclassified Arsukibacterium]|uniref:E22 family MetX-like putative esterase n=1 Tax=unclassified Arsukibacterium TaxID=2635278 RepID=UPI000C3A7833|nr:MULTISPECIES: homoserine O-acetyltransferase [unclassified Arsukibacterium]MAA93309.1 homoserine acetyltransferase [Rheinheimera sp.]MBM34199.1 homoserine acetyltransferase [Rheinheimera sp.]HAW92199.1 homoserine O-acetyltransferase [Candidatus Azambacteria bacterium]|tara:strand:+ start:94235 stop:95404 length:1170 start_codon:yes stop_codon:yes gene_type:complete